MDLIEKAAMALCLTDCGYITENELARCMDGARAAIEAIREPTVAMVEAGERESGKKTDCEAIWAAMIDQLLSEPQAPKP